MDAGTAYNAHSSQAKKQNRSSTNLNHLSLAPLTTKIPINDPDMIFSDITVETSYSTSYIQGKSAPTTPSLLARSPMRGKSPSLLHGTATPPAYGHGYGSMTPLAKSKSATHLDATRGRKPRSGTTTPGGHRRGPKRDEQEDPRSMTPAIGRTDSDWMLRAGVLLSSETREYKGQSWLVSRVSSTSLGRMNEDENRNPDAFEKERIARENIITSRHASRRGSMDFAIEEDGSPFASRRNSLHASRTGSRTQLFTPGEHAAVESYFSQQQQQQFLPMDELAAGPDFINLDEKLEGFGFEVDTSQDDEAAVRRLVKGGQGRPNTWFGNIMGWGLFSVDENDEESEEADGEEVMSDGDLEESGVLEVDPNKHFKGVTSLSEQRLPPPKSDEGGWQDAAWLLSVASKVAWS